MTTRILCAANVRDLIETLDRAATALDKTPDYILGGTLRGWRTHLLHMAVTDVAIERENERAIIHAKVA